MLRPITCLIILLLSSFPAHAETGMLKVAILGDSLIAGFGIPRESSFPSQLQKRINEDFHQVQIIQRSLSGFTTEDGIQRLGLLLKEDPDVVLLGLGMNDVKSDIPLKITYENLETIISALQKKGVLVILIGMIAPNNIDQDYRAGFNAIYPTLAQIHTLNFYPFYLKGVAAIPAYSLDDGIHPNALGISMIVDSFYPFFNDVMMRNFSHHKK